MDTEQIEKLVKIEERIIFLREWRSDIIKDWEKTQFVSDDDVHRLTVLNKELFELRKVREDINGHVRLLTLKKELSELKPIAR